MMKMSQKKGSSLLTSFGGFDNDITDDEVMKELMKLQVGNDDMNMGDFSSMPGSDAPSDADLAKIAMAALNTVKNIEAPDAEVDTTEALDDGDVERELQKLLSGGAAVDDEEDTEEMSTPQEPASRRIPPPVNQSTNPLPTSSPAVIQSPAFTSSPPPKPQTTTPTPQSQPQNTTPKTQAAPATPTLEPAALTQIQQWQALLEKVKGKLVEDEGAGLTERIEYWSQTIKGLNHDIALLRKGIPLASVLALRQQRTAAQSASSGAKASPRTHSVSAPSGSSVYPPMPTISAAEREKRTQEYLALKRAIIETCNAKSALWNKSRGASKGGAGRLSTEETKKLVSEVAELKGWLEKVKMYETHPTLPPCPTWIWAVDTETKVLKNDAISPEALQITIKGVKNLKDHRGSPLSGEVAVVFSLPVPESNPIVGRTTFENLERNGCVTFDYVTSPGIRPRAASTTRLVSRKCMVVEIERQSKGGFLKMRKQTSVIARGAFPLSPLLTSANVISLIALWDESHNINFDGIEVQGSFRNTSSDLMVGAEGMCGAVEIELQLHTPLKEGAVQVEETRKPVITHWYPLQNMNPPSMPSLTAPPNPHQHAASAPAARAAAGSSNSAVATGASTGSASGASVHSSSSAPPVSGRSAAAAPSAGSAAASPASARPALTPEALAEKFPLLAQLGVAPMLFMRAFTPTLPVFYEASGNLLTAELDAEGVNMDKAMARRTELESAVAKLSNAKSDDALSELEDVKKELNTVTSQLIISVQRIKAMEEARDQLGAKINGGELSLPDYATGIDNAIKRDEQLIKALELLGKKSFVEVVEGRIKIMKAELQELQSMDG